MKAAIYERYGPPDVVQIRDVERPVPNDGEVLIRVRAASVGPYDWHFMRARRTWYASSPACPNQRIHASAPMSPAKWKRLAGA